MTERLLLGRKRTVCFVEGTGESGLSANDPIADLAVSCCIGDMEQEVSERIIHQRMRNRIMESLIALADGNDGVRREWPDEYFCSFYDWIPHRGDGGMYPNEAIIEQERKALVKVAALMDEACDATPQIISADEFIATGWPERIQPAARQALELMKNRGLFREDIEEQEPSNGIDDYEWAFSLTIKGTG